MEKIQKKILFVDDDKLVCHFFKLHVQKDYEVECFSSGREAYEAVALHPEDYFMAFVDHKLEGPHEKFPLGSELAKKIKEINEDIVIVMASGDTTKETYNAWVLANVDMILYKPASKDDIINNIKSALVKYKTRNNQAYPPEAKGKIKEIGLIGVSRELEEVSQAALVHAKTDADVLILGETGTGKELFARAIHEKSNRSKGPFIAVNCSSYSDNSHLLESHLFGHVKGAFTGANENHEGAFAMAHKGTIFLDELHQLSKNSQAKLLRAVEEKRIKKLGSNQEVGVDFRLICAAKPDIKKEIQEGGSFHPDLYYRISCFELSIPSLRDRREDILPLADHFKSLLEDQHGKKKRFDSSAIKALKGHSWPGNVRELRNVIYKAFHLHDGNVIKGRDLPSEINQEHLDKKDVERSDLTTLKNLCVQTEKKIILDALIRNNHNVKEAASFLGMNRSTLSTRLRSLNLLAMDKDERSHLFYRIKRNIFSMKKRMSFSGNL